MLDVCRIFIILNDVNIACCCLMRWVMLVWSYDIYCVYSDIAVHRPAFVALNYLTRLSFSYGALLLPWPQYRKDVSSVANIKFVGEGIQLLFFALVTSDLDQMTYWPWLWTCLYFLYTRKWRSRHARIIIWSSLSSLAHNISHQSFVPHLYPHFC